MTTLDKIMDFEAGELNDMDTLDLFAELIKTGQAWALQGSYGRFAQSLIDDKLITKEGEIDFGELQDKLDKI